MFSDRFGSASLHRTSRGFERCFPWLPTQCMGYNTRWHDEARDIFGDIIGLNDVLRVFLAGFSPPAQLYVQFTSNFIGFGFIQRVYPQDCRRLKIGAILYGESIGAISETAG